MFWLLVACGTEIGGGGETPIDVSVAPTTVAVQLDDVAMYCNQTDYRLWEPMGAFHIVNDGADYVQVDIYATHTSDDVYLSDFEPGTAPWMDVSVSEDQHRNLEPGGQMDVELFAMGRCYDVDEDVFDRFQVYVYEVEVLLRDEPTTVRGEIRLTPRA